MPRTLVLRRVIEVTWDEVENGETLSDEDEEKLNIEISEEFEKNLNEISRNLHMKYGVQVEVR